MMVEMHLGASPCKAPPPHTKKCGKSIYDSVIFREKYEAR